MSIITIVTDAKKVKAMVASTIKQYTTVLDKFQQVTVNVLWHVSKHRDPSLINSFYAGLSAGHKQSFKRYVAHYVAREYDEGTKSSHFWLNMAKDEFIVLKGTSAQSDRFHAMVNEAVAKANADEPDPKDAKFGRFFEWDPTKIPNAFDDAAVHKQLQNLMKKAQSDKSEVSVDTIKALAAAIKTFDTLAPAVPDAATVPAAPASGAPAAASVH